MAMAENDKMHYPFTVGWVLKTLRITDFFKSPIFHDLY